MDDLVSIDEFARSEESSDKSLLVVERLLSALSFIHGLGVAHGDIKPDKVLIDIKTLSCRLLGASFGCESGDTGMTLVAQEGFSSTERSARQKDLCSIGDIVLTVFSKFPWSTDISEVLKGERYVDTIEMLPSYIKSKRSKAPSPIPDLPCPIGALLGTKMATDGEVTPATTVLIDHGVYRTIGFYMKSKSPRLGEQLDSWVGLVDKRFHLMQQSGYVLLLHSSGLLLSGLVVVDSGCLDVSELDVLVLPMISPNDLIEFRLFNGSDGLMVTVFHNLYDVASFPVKFDLTAMLGYSVCFQTDKSPLGITLSHDWVASCILNSKILEEQKKSANKRNETFCESVCYDYRNMDVSTGVYGKLKGFSVNPLLKNPMGYRSRRTHECSTMIGPTQRTIYLSQLMDTVSLNVMFEVVASNPSTSSLILRIHTFSKCLLSVDTSQSKVVCADKVDPKKKIPQIAIGMVIGVEINSSTGKCVISLGTKFVDILIGNSDTSSLFLTMELTEGTVLRHVTKSDQGILMGVLPLATNPITLLPHKINQDVASASAEGKILYTSRSGGGVVLFPPLIIGDRYSVLAIPGTIQVSAGSGNFCVGLVEGIPPKNLTINNIEELESKYCIVFKDGLICKHTETDRVKTKSSILIKPNSIVTANFRSLFIDGYLCDNGGVTEDCSLAPTGTPIFFVVLFENVGEVRVSSGTYIM